MPIPENCVTPSRLWSFRCLQIVQMLPCSTTRVCNGSTAANSRTWCEPATSWMASRSPHTLFGSHIGNADDDVCLLGYQQYRSTVDRHMMEVRNQDCRDSERRPYGQCDRRDLGISTAPWLMVICRIRYSPDTMWMPDNSGRKSMPCRNTIDGRKA